MPICVKVKGAAFLNQRVLKTVGINSAQHHKETSPMGSPAVDTHSVSNMVSGTSSKTARTSSLSTPQRRFRGVQGTVDMISLQHPTLTVSSTTQRHRRGPAPLSDIAEVHFNSLQHPKISD